MSLSVAFNASRLLATTKLTHQGRDGIRMTMRLFMSPLQTASQRVLYFVLMQEYLVRLGL